MAALKKHQSFLENDLLPRSTGDWRIGKEAFYTLRQKVQRQRGVAFDLGKFHEEVLNQGCISVKYLPELFGVR